MSDESTSVDALTPLEFERFVRRFFMKEAAGRLDDLATANREVVPAADGSYEFDVTVRFTLFGGSSYLVVVECKKHARPIERDIVQVLQQKKLSVAAEKAMLFATAPFRRGAIEFAKRHRIALIRVEHDSMQYVTRNPAKSLPTQDALALSAWLVRPSTNGGYQDELLGVDRGKKWISAATGWIIDILSEDTTDEAQ